MPQGFGAGGQRTLVLVLVAARAGAGVVGVRRCKVARWHRDICEGAWGSRDCRMVECVMMLAVVGDNGACARAEQDTDGERQWLEGDENERRKEGMCEDL